MRRSLCEQCGDVGKAEAVPGFEPLLADPVLLGVMEAAEADAPAIGRLKRDAAVGAGADMGTLDWQPLAAGDRAVMAAYPGAVSRAFA